MKITSSKELASHLVSQYSNNKHLNINKLPDFEMHELAALIIQEEPELAKEATSVDNPHYETIMLPALIKHMECSTDKSLRNDFDEAWLKGIALYLEKIMQSLLDEQYIDQFVKEKNDYSYPVMNRKSGEIEWRI